MRPLCGEAVTREGSARSIQIKTFYQRIGRFCFYRDNRSCNSQKKFFYLCKRMQAQQSADNKLK